MSLSENTQHWLERMRAEEAAIRGDERAVVAAMQLAEVEFALGLDHAARGTLRRCLERFDVLHPGVWTSLVIRAAQLGGRLGENEWLGPELGRGMGWAAQPDIVQYQTDLPTRVHDLAIQLGRADVAAEQMSNEWPGQAAHMLIDACQMAGWARDATALRRLLPQARATIEKAGPGPDHLSHIGYELVRACVRAGLLAEAAELCQASGLVRQPTDELVIALWQATDRAAYHNIRDSWLNHRIEQFRTDARGQYHWCSGAVRHAAETIRRLGDADGYRNAVAQFREVVAVWRPPQDLYACFVNCDLAVLCANAGDAPTSAHYFSTAKQLFEGKASGVPTARGNRSLMATILSAAYRDIGHTDLAVRHARKTSHSGDRRACLITALILGGRVSEADEELAKLDSPQDRAVWIGTSLLTEFRVDRGGIILCRPE